MTASLVPGRVLVIGAHPDDAELYAGGTIANWLSSGAVVGFLILTDGRLGSHDPAIDPAEVAVTRLAEAKAAARILGVDEIVFGGSADGNLEHSREAATELVAATIRGFRPDIVIGHDPWRLYELHPDHRAAGFATTDGAIGAREWNAFPSLRERGLAPHRAKELWLMGTTQPDVYIDIEAALPKKLDALAAHESQFAHLDDWREKVEGWARQVGAERGYRAAEAFHRINPAQS